MTDSCSDNQLYVATPSPARSLEAEYTAWGHSSVVRYYHKNKNVFSFLKNKMLSYGLSSCVKSSRLVLLYFNVLYQCCGSDLK